MLDDADADDSAEELIRVGQKGGVADGGAVVGVAGDRGAYLGGEQIEPVNRPVGAENKIANVAVAAAEIEDRGGKVEVAHFDHFEGAEEADGGLVVVGVQQRAQDVAGRHSDDRRGEFGGHEADPVARCRSSARRCA